MKNIGESYANGRNLENDTGKKTVNPVMLNSMSIKDQSGSSSRKFQTFKQVSEGLNKNKSLQLFKTTGFDISPNNTFNSPDTGTK